MESKPVLKANYSWNHVDHLNYILVYLGVITEDQYYDCFNAALAKYNK